MLARAPQGLTDDRWVSQAGRVPGAEQEEVVPGARDFFEAPAGHHPLAPAGQDRLDGAADLC